MPDHNPASESTTLAALGAEISRLNARVDARDAENARLEARLGELEARDRSGDRPNVAGGVESTAVEAAHEQPAVSQVVSRRGAFKVLGAAAAGGVGVALGSAIVSTEPAAATTGAMMYGAVNEAGTDATVLNATTPGGHVTFYAENATSDGFGLYGVVVVESGIVATEGSAVVGDTNGSGAGVEGLSAGGYGVHGVSGSLIDGLGSQGSAGVVGEADNGTGVVGLSTSSNGVFGLSYAFQNAAVYAQNLNGVGGTGVWGYSSGGIGAYFAGGFAPLQLGLATGTTGPPTGTGHQAGEIYVDADGAIFYCYAGDGQTTSEWVALTNGTFPIPPVRVIDTADGTGGITGPLVPGSTVHTSAAIAGTNGIPAAAVGVVGNLAISGVNGALLNGVGFATLFPAGEQTPATANINAGAGCFAISNAVTVGLGSGGSNAGKLSLVWSGGGPVPHAEAYFDVTGYIL